MKKREVKELVVSIEEELSITPSVAAEDRITDAVEVMLNNDLTRIAVIQEDKVMGMIRLEDALKAIGLEGDIDGNATKTVVSQGHKIVIQSTSEQQDT